MYLQKYFPRAPAVSAVGMVSWGFSHAMMALSPCVLSHHCSFDMQLFFFTFQFYFVEERLELLILYISRKILSL